MSHRDDMQLLDLRDEIEDLEAKFRMSAEMGDWSQAAFYKLALENTKRRYEQARTDG